MIWIGEGQDVRKEEVILEWLGVKDLIILQKNEDLGQVRGMLVRVNWDRNSL